jgi:hypothetical protein
MTDKQDDQPLDLTKQSEPEQEAPKLSEAEIAAQIADDAKSEAEDAEVKAEEAEAAAEALSADEVSEALVACEKEIAKARKARSKLDDKITELEDEHVRLGKLNDAANPRPSFSQSIQSVLASQNAKRRAGKEKPNPIDVAGAGGPTPFQL